jgi:hypothetical protein
MPACVVIDVHILGIYYRLLNCMLLSCLECRNLHPYASSQVVGTRVCVCLNFKRFFYTVFHAS